MIAVFLSIRCCSDYPVNVHGFLQYRNALAFQTEPMDMTTPLFLNMQGKQTCEVRAGQQVMIIESVRNNVYLNEDKPLVVIVEVRDQYAETDYLAYQGAVVTPNDTYIVGMLWTVPTDAPSGEYYAVRTFAITSFEEGAEPLAGVLEFYIKIR